MIKNVAAAVAVLALAGCGTVRTNADVDQFMRSRWMGHNITEAISGLGQPESVRTMPDGSRMYTFTRSETSTTPVYVTPTYTSPSQTRIRSSASGNTFYATTTPGVTSGGQVYGGNTVRNYCSVSLFESTGIIKAFRWEGDACKYSF
jgi:hypothetical protein